MTTCQPPVASRPAERRACLMELDSPYCDVILARSRELFHDEPRLKTTRRTYVEIAELRGDARVSDGAGGP